MSGMTIEQRVRNDTISFHFVVRNFLTYMLGKLTNWAGKANRKHVDYSDDVFNKQNHRSLQTDLCTLTCLDIIHRSQVPLSLPLIRIFILPNGETGNVVSYLWFILPGSVN